MNRTFKYALSAALSALLIVPALAQDNFPDVPESHWAYKELARMKQEGLLVGYPDGLFRGGRPASRYELAVAVYAAWSNLKGVTDGLKTQIDDITSRLGNAATKQDIDNLKSMIDALTAEVNRIKSEDIAQLRRMADEFRTELAKMGVDVDQLKKDMGDMKGKVDELWLHRLPFDVTGDANVWMGGAYSRSSRLGGFGISNDGRPEGFGRAAAGPTPVGATQDLTILHEGAIRMTSNNKTGPVWNATMVFGNMLGDFSPTTPGGPFIDQSRVYPATPFGEGFSQWYFQDFNVTFDTSLLGLGFNAEVGRFGYKVSPYIYQRPDNTPYFANDRWDNGLWNTDGGVLGFKFGKAKLDVFGGRQNTGTGTFITSLQPMFAGASGVPFTPGVMSRPRGFNRNNDMGGGGSSGLFIDQQLGAHLSVPLANTGALSLAYLWMDANNPQTVPGGATAVNRVSVLGGDLNFKFSNIDVEGGYSQSNLMTNATSVVNRNNYAWYATAGFAGSKWGLKAGYRDIQPQFAAPGDWGRIGIWWNPTDIKGWYADAHYDLNKDFRLSANGGMYTGHGQTINGNAGLATGDHLDHFQIGLGYKMGANHSLLLGYESIMWNLSGSLGAGTAKPTERWYNVGFGLDLSSRAKWTLLWQISDYDSKGVIGMGPFGTGAGAGQTIARGGLISSQLTFRF